MRRTASEARSEMPADGSEAAGVDLLVTDVIMPSMDGPSLARRLREARPSLKVIFISGYTEDRFSRHLDLGPGIHFLPKPFSLKQLATKVKEVMQEDTEHAA